MCGLGSWLGLSRPIFKALSFAFALSTPNLAASPASSQPHINIKSRTVTMRLLVKFNVFPDKLFRAKVHDLRPSYPSLRYICYSPAEFFRTGVLCSIFFTKENLWRIIHHLSLSRDPSTIRDVYHRSQTPLDGYFNISFFYFILLIRRSASQHQFL